MSWTLLVTLLAASAGLVSGAWLCFPTAVANPHALAWVADPPYKSADGTTELLIGQSAQYWVGGLFLVVAFLLQVIAALIPVTAQTIGFGDHFLLVIWAAVLLFCFTFAQAGVGFWLYRMRRDWIRAAVCRAADALAAKPRLTPLP